MDLTDIQNLVEKSLFARSRNGSSIYKRSTWASKFQNHRGLYPCRVQRLAEDTKSSGSLRIEIEMGLGGGFGKAILAKFADTNIRVELAKFGE